MADSKFGIAGIALLILGVILFFGVLNYFNVISLSSLYPNQLGSLPHIPPFKEPAKAKSTNIAVFCPSVANSCGGQQIIINGKYAGIGFKIAPGINFKATFAGTAVFKSEKTGASHVNITGKGEALGYEAIYDYFPYGSGSAALQVKDVIANEPLERVGIGSFDQKGTNLMFRLMDKNGKNIELKPSDFKL